MSGVRAGVSVGVNTVAMRMCMKMSVRRMPQVHSTQQQ
jgi:hypothetical protein